MRNVRLAVLLAASLYLVAAPAGAAPLREAPVIDRAEPDCTQIPPEVTPPLAIEKTPVLPLEARIMYEPGALRVVKEHMSTARDAFARIGVRLKLRYDEVDPPDHWPSEFFDEPSGDEIMGFMKSQYGGLRPAGVDVVYYMTGYWSGGLADCIGGVRFPDRAFAFGSLEYALEGGPSSPTADEGVIAAHEIGHLLGAHHHYSNCTEALPSGATRGDVNPCTTMSPLATTASSTFSTLEASYIRHYVAKYAKG
ncbi:MAG TPA: zinc-dependent metalloprotease family protein [Actinomycetota bacterium]|nr:zinc-dependent metalloprotease family protein [Actinomycetota bacterium]